MTDRGHSDDATPLATPTEGEPRGASRSFRVVEAGDRLGRFELLEAIGEGGMASVFRARDPELRRDVAIKVLFPHLSRREEVVRRFQREARAAARLHHPAILQTFDVGGGEDGEPPHIIMELVRGASLHEHLAAHPPMLAEVVACLGVVIAEALAVAHDAGVIHRDLKPGNLLVSQDGRVLLADFGVAHVERDESLATRTGAVLGTPAYMSPEQASGEDIDGRSDLYSLGATLYHVATGAPPYSGSAMKVMSSLATPGALVPPAQRRAAIGRPLSDAILRLMAHDPAARPATAREAAELLRPLTAPLGEPAAALEAYCREPASYVEAATPRVVTRLLDDARAAQRAGRLAGALALVDRAAQLAPEDDAVATLVRDVTARRGRVVGVRRAAAVALVAVAAFGAVAAIVLGGRAPGGTATPSEAASAAGAVDAALGLVDASPASASAAPGDAAPADARLSDAERAEVAERAELHDAQPARARPSTPDAARRRPPPEVVGARPEVVADAAPSPSASATPSEPATSPPVEPAGAAEPRRGAAIFAMDAWCELSVDGVRRGRADRTAAIPLAEGPHAAVCTQGPGLGEWRGAFEVRAGETREVRGALRRQVRVTVSVSGTSVTIAGKTIDNRAQVSLDNGRHRVTILRGAKDIGGGWVSIPRVASCTLRDQPVLDCYP